MRVEHRGSAFHHLRQPPAPRLRVRAARAGVRRRYVPHPLQHAQALQGVPLNVIQPQLRDHTLGVTFIYPQPIDPRRDHGTCTAAGHQ